MLSPSRARSVFRSTQFKLASSRSEFTLVFTSLFTQFFTP